MPVVPSAFSPPPLLGNGHLQTILPLLLPRRLPITFRPELLELPDGDFLHLGWLKTSHAGGQHGATPRSGIRPGADHPRRQQAANAPRSGTSQPRLAILSHGLESDFDAGYIRGMAHTLHARGWDVLAWCLRGCGPQSNRLPRFYHSGETGDLAAVIDRAAAEYRQIALIGFSLGGNITLKYLGEPAPHSAVIAGVAISAPVDLTSSAHCPLTPETHHLLNAQTIARMQPGSLLINTARGGVVDVLAVLDALNRGHLAGAAIDVLETEPPADDHPLLRAWRDPASPVHDRLILNPHSAFYSEEGLMDMRIKGSENCRRVLLGEAPRNVVNL
jgi:pimeloyl-ACP methyl ester carboxylesterase